MSDVSDRIETLLDLARTAAALRRYHEAQGSYPEQLDQLVPAYAARVPTDRFSGEAYRYERRGEGFLLYSVGLNEQDDQADDISDEVINGEWLEIDTDPIDIAMDRGDDLVIRIPVPSVKLPDFQAVPPNEAID